MKDKIVLVTGSGRGIGKTIALRFGQLGAKVVVNDINPDTAEAASTEIKKAGGEAINIIADVSNKLAVQTMHYEIIEKFGRVDVLINNAGVEPTGSILTLDEWAWDRTLNVNLKGAFLCSQTVGRAMKEQGGGVIVNISSIAGRAAGLRDRAAYVASKTGLVGFTRECAREFAAYNIRVNAVCPGVIITEMTAHLRQNEAQMKKWMEDIPQARLGEPDDVTGLVVFLCSDESKYITGQAFNVDGGKVMS